MIANGLHLHFECIVANLSGGFNLQVDLMIVQVVKVGSKLNIFMKKRQKLKKWRLVKNKIY
jgi:hypothetical protein